MDIIEILFKLGFGGGFIALGVYEFVKEEAWSSHRWGLCAKYTLADDGWLFLFIVGVKVVIGAGLIASYFNR